MRFSKIPVIMLPFILVGCLDSSDEDSGSFYAPASAPAASTSTTTAPEGCGCSGQPSPSISSAPPASSAVREPQPALDWHPLEGHLVRAGDLVMELKHSNGGISPSHAAMATHIQTNMGLTASQAEMVLDELGL